VKNIVTPRRVAVLITCVFFVLLLTTTPMYLVYGLGFKFYSDRNKTLIGMVITGDRETIEGIYYLINSVCIPFGAFTIIISCTVILVIQLHNKNKWRNKSVVSVQGDNVSLRNKKVSKMVVMITAMFIVCFAPFCFVFLAMTLEPELSIVGKYRDMFIILGGIGALLECINSSSNIFFYYRMSSRYRSAIGEIFCYRK
jgi:hypothetical protein